MSNNIDVYIINLSTSLDRKSKMQENIATWQRCNPHNKDKINFKFFKAKTPQDVKTSGFINRYNRFMAWIWKARDVRLTEMACFYSHFTLWEKCVEINKAFFILEDDVDFTPIFFDGLQDIIKQSYEYVRISFRTFHKMILVKENFAFGHALILGASGYYITPNAAKKLIKHSNKIYIAVDYYISSSYIHNVVEMVYSYPLVKINELDANSTIGKPEHQVKSKADKKRYKKFVIFREIHRIYRQIRTILFAITRFYYIK
ncbi:hypothetical protein DCO58_00540 [Helicobacter saguini]|uniref:Glycosyl transferase family 25 domain-containing protein n=1 Tax=Helicobacter saguini TaxID=1548018 RepID=A0A347VQX3_9HELI|nr:glycosyltransferase family 25 protein [Helicobacter saguini]MWV63122.1 hypothetical protein [Helicobacter saguini]MWV66208.1 hypothetical protein [Helicobacter saguini]MWV68558.1 hypothetical protein [Helicobacter saguini]MWV71888.1 hypothetical protein [Helicobacter saguini]TLD95903.1 hypothetical protein LS64_000615 [Helicobacter saguini]